MPLICYVAAYDVFVRAEHRKFAGNYRLGKFWRRFQSPAMDAELVELTSAKESLLSAELSGLGNRRARIVELNHDTSSKAGILATIYSDNGKHVKPQIRHDRVQFAAVPEVVEFAISYSPAQRLIETVGRGFELADHGKVGLHSPLFADCVEKLPCVLGRTLIPFCFGSGGDSDDG